SRPRVTAGTAGTRARRTPTGEPAPRAAATGPTTPAPGLAVTSIAGPGPAVTPIAGPGPTAMPIAIPDPARTAAAESSGSIPPPRGLRARGACSGGHRTAVATAAKWQPKPTRVPAWKISWNPNQAGDGFGRLRP